MDNQPKINRAKLTEEQRAKLEQYQQAETQLQTLEDIAKMTQEIINIVDDSGNVDKIGTLLIDIRETLGGLRDKEAPETPDYAKPVVDAVSKLEKALSASIKGIDVKPQIKVDAPAVNVSPPSVDLKGVEKALKTDMPKAFKDALALIPKPEKPDFKPLLSAWEGISEQLESIENATRAKPLPGSMKVTNPDGSVIGGSSGITGTLSNVTMTGASVTLQASNTSRRNLMIFNDSGVTIYVKLGSTASSSSFTVKMVDQSYYELPTPVYTGIVTALGASGSVRVTEVA